MRSNRSKCAIRARAGKRLRGEEQEVAERRDETAEQQAPRRLVGRELLARPHDSEKRAGRDGGQDPARYRSHVAEVRDVEHAS